MRTTGYWLLQVLPFVILAALVATMAIDLPQFQSLRRATFDVYQEIRPRQAPTDGPAVVVVEIDQESQRRVGPWPWPRSRIAALFDTLGTLGARATASLIDLSRPDPNAPQRLLLRLPPLKELDAIKARFSGWTSQDKALARAIAKTPATVGFHATAIAAERLPGRKTTVDAPDGIADKLVRLEGAAAPIQLIQAAAAGIGAVPPTLPAGRVTRRLPMVFLIGGRIYPAVLTELARLTRKARRITLGNPMYAPLLFGGATPLGTIDIGDLKIPVDGRGWVSLHAARSTPARRIAAWRLLAGEAGAKRIRNRIVIVTVRQPSTPLWRTPLGDTVTEPVLMAQALEQILQGRFILRPAFAQDLEIAYVLIVSLLLILLLGRVRGYGALFIIVTAALLLPVAGWAAFAVYGWQIDGTVPALMVVAVSIAAAAAAAARQQTHREALMLRFQRNLPPKLLSQIVQAENRAPPAEDVRTVTSLQVVIREFDELVDRLGASEMNALARRLFSPSTSVLFSRGGTLDKVGHGRLEAFWNAPITEPMHERQACKAALEIMTTAARLNERLAAEGQEGKRPPELDIAIGIETGEAFVGDTGVAQRYEYAVLGAPVTDATFLAAQSRYFSANVVLGPGTAAGISGLAIMELDLLQRPGRPPLPIYALLGDAPIAEDAAFKQLKSVHDSMLAHYRARRWAEAQNDLAPAREMAAGRLDALYDLYSGRIRAFRTTPPPDDWDGSMPGGA